MILTKTKLKMQNNPKVTLKKCEKLEINKKEMKHG